MKRLILVLATAGLLIILVLLMIRRDSGAKPQPRIIQTNTAGQATKANATINNLTNAEAAEEKLVAQAFAKATSWEEQTKIARRHVNHRPIAFYGKVIDDHGIPVEGANVRASIDNIEHNSPLVTLLNSDQNGQFKLEGKMGWQLCVMVKKEGYYMIETNNVFSYSLLRSPEVRHKPDRSQPVLFYMWKKRGAEPLLGMRIRDVCLEPAATNRYDLVTGKRVLEGGDIIVQYDSNYRVEMVEGGIIPITPDEYRFCYEAPETGYMDFYEDLLKVTNSATYWNQHYFVVTSGNGKRYGKINLVVREGHNKGETVVGIEGYINTNASRNLEPTK